MKSKLIVILAIVLATAIAALAAPTTITGVITDDMCSKKHMMPGKSDAECVRECVKAGANYAVVSDGKVYILKGKEAKLNELAGKKVTVTGELSGKTLAVSDVKAAK